MGLDPSQLYDDIKHAENRTECGSSPPWNFL